MPLLSTLCREKLLQDLVEITRIKMDPSSHLQKLDSCTAQLVQHLLPLRLGSCRLADEGICRHLRRRCSCQGNVAPNVTSGTDDKNAGGSHCENSVAWGLGKGLIELRDEELKLGCEIFELMRTNVLFKRCEPGWDSSLGMAG